MMMVSQILGTLVSPKELINRAAKSSPGLGSRARYNLALAKSWLRHLHAGPQLGP